MGELKSTYNFIDCQIDHFEQWGNSSYFPKMWEHTSCDKKAIVVTK